MTISVLYQKNNRSFDIVRHLSKPLVLYRKKYKNKNTQMPFAPAYFPLLTFFEAIIL